MSKDLMIIGLGVWVVLLPFLGFPSSWDTWIFVATGIAIIVLMLLLRRDLVRYIERIRGRTEGGDGVFVESNGVSHAHAQVSVPESPQPAPGASRVAEESNPESSPQPKAPVRGRTRATPPKGVRARRVSVRSAESDNHDDTTEKES